VFTMNEFSEKEPVQHRGGGKVNEERACEIREELEERFRGRGSNF
jgi:hypothetical protein